MLFLVNVKLPSSMERFDIFCALNNSYIYVDVVRNILRTKIQITLELGSYSLGCCDFFPSVGA